MRYFLLSLIILIALVQWVLWFGNDGIIDLWESRQNLQASRLENNELEYRNNELKAEVIDLQTGLQAVEERARSELGLVKEDETFIQIIEKKPSDNNSKD